MVTDRVDDTTKTQTQEEATVWLIGDRHGKRQEQLANAGWNCFSKCGSIHTDLRREMLSRIAEDKPRLLYIVECGGMGNNLSSADFLQSLIDEQLKVCGLI